MPPEASWSLDENSSSVSAVTNSPARAKERHLPLASSEAMNLTSSSECDCSRIHSSLADVLRGRWSEPSSRPARRNPKNGWPAPIEPMLRYTASMLLLTQSSRPSSAGKSSRKKRTGLRIAAIISQNSSLIVCVWEEDREQS